MKYNIVVFRAHKSLVLKHRSLKLISSTQKIIIYIFYSFIFLAAIRPKNDLNIEEDSEYDPKNDNLNYDDIPEDFPLVSERAGHGDHSDNSADEKRVQFGIKKPTVVTPPSLSYDEQPNDNLHERKRRKRYSQCSNFIYDLNAFDESYH